MSGKHPAKTSWEQTDKTRAVAVYKATGNLAKTARITGIPERTLHTWVKQDWWSEKVKQLRAEDTAELEQAYTDIAKESQSVVKDRLANGDFVLDKDGKIIRKPVSLRDAALVGAISVDKRKILGEEPQREQELGTAERLIKLVEQFARFANARQINNIVEKEQLSEERIIDAVEVEETASDDGSSSPQPEVRQESGNSSVSG